MSIEKIVSLCKRRGFVFQSSEIYGGYGAVYDYGPLGIELKNKISQPRLSDLFVMFRFYVIGISNNFIFTR